MMKEPWFWREDTPAARAVAASLAPAAAAYGAAQRWRMAAVRPEKAPIPVICVGNATLGGVGKTPFALMLARLLNAQGLTPHFLTRGYRGTVRGPVQVDPQIHHAGAVGDEALLLAAAAATWVARDRAAGARAAAVAGADLVIMDDGLQNPTLQKTLSFLLIAGEGADAGRLFPAGPLREPFERAASRAGAVVDVVQSKDAAAAAVAIGAHLPRFRAWLEPAATQIPSRGVAFCGIGRPQRFFDMLVRLGCDVDDAVAFPDHHKYSDADIAHLKKKAAAAGTTLITTEKDFARLRPDQRPGVTTLKVAMRCDRPAEAVALALAAIDRFNDARAGHA